MLLLLLEVFHYNKTLVFGRRHALESGNDRTGVKHLCKKLSHYDVDVEIDYND